jgi:hypothetical protein
VPLFQPKRDKPRRHWLWLQHFSDDSINIKVELAATKHSCSSVQHHKNSAKHTDDGATNLGPALMRAQSRRFSAGTGKNVKLENKEKCETSEYF